MVRTLIGLTVVALALPFSTAFGLGFDDAPRDLPHRTEWPAGLYDAVNTPERVHGYWINTSDTLFYESDHLELNQMIGKLAALPGVDADIVLHVGPGTAKTAYSRKLVGPADWSVRIGGNLHVNASSGRKVTVDIWLGRNLQLEDLKVPAALAVRSGGEIEAFVDDHESPKRER